MEVSILTVVLAGWALMLFVPSVFIAAVASAGFGVAISFMFHLEQGGVTDLMGDILLIAPVAAGAVFIAWPFGMVFRWVLRRR